MTPKGTFTPDSMAFKDVQRRSRDCNGYRWNCVKKNTGKPARSSANEMQKIVQLHKNKSNVINCVWGNYLKQIILIISCIKEHILCNKKNIT